MMLICHRDIRKLSTGRMIPPLSEDVPGSIKGRVIVDMCLMRNSLLNKLRYPYIDMKKIKIDFKMHFLYFIMFIRKAEICICCKDC
jgi:hypothetical protein